MHRPLVRRALVIVLGVPLVLITLTGTAAAYWHSSGAGAGGATTATLTAPTGVTVPAVSQSSVAVDWTASSGSLAPSGYYVVHKTGATSGPACSSSPTTLITGTSCTDTGVADGTYTYVVTAVYRSWTAVGAASGSVVVSTATSLAFVVQPSNTTAAVAISPAVTVALTSASGAAVAASNVSISVAIATNPAAGTLSGTLTVLTNSSGVATFNGLSIGTAGVGYTLAASSAGLTSTTSSAFTISVGAATQLAFTTSPTASFAGTVFFTQPVVAIEDAGGNVVTTSTSNVTLSLTVANGAVLSCTSARAAIGGIATYTTCAIDKAGTYSLTAQSGTLTTATSGTFTITAAPTRLAWNTPTTTVCGAPSGNSFALSYFNCALAGSGTFTSKVSLTDASGTVLVNLGAAITVTVSPAHGSVTATTLTIAHGQTASSTSSTFTPAYVLLLTSDTATASTAGLTSATATLHALLV